jgi:predicted HicB family RNase H-like nuclease
VNAQKKMKRRMKMADADWMNLCREKLKEISYTYNRKFDYKVHKEYGISLVMEKERTQVLFPFYTKKAEDFYTILVAFEKGLEIGSNKF